MTGAGLNRREVMLGAAAGGVALTMAQSAGAIVPQDVEKVGSGRRQPFNLGWQFHRAGDLGTDGQPSDPRDWRDLDLPHDWSIEDLPAGSDGAVGPFTPKAVGGASAGFAVGGEGWYRKRFRIAVPGPGKVELLFDGVYIESTVWLNGKAVARHRNGYTPFACDLTPYLSASGENEIVVRVRNLGVNQRWYSGSGIYRDVWLDVYPQASHLTRWGTRVVTREIADGAATLAITTELTLPGQGRLVSRIFDSDGRKVWEGAADAGAVVRQTATIAQARPWSPDSPRLYRLETELHRGTEVLDRASTVFGIRIVSFDAEQGMTLNGIPTKLRGGCIHHDHGILGAAGFADAEARKVRLLKARGFNALRPSHNPFSHAFLDACDRLGMMVIGEAFDVWHEPKFSPDDYSRAFASDWQSDLDTLVRSARHHPSVIMWSIGNEIPGRNNARGVETQWQLANRVHQLDPSRPVTAGIHGFPGLETTPDARAARPGTAGIPDRTSTVFLDVIGYNYKLADYEADHRRFPSRVFYGSESFPKEVFAIWEMTERHPWLVGDFVWTAMDYLGEAGIGGSSVVAAGEPGAGPGTSEWPWVNAYCGDIDLIGGQKPSSLARDVVWGISPLEMLVRRPVPAGQIEIPKLWGWFDELPSWTWPGAEGRPLGVSIYTSGDRIDLTLDGRKLESREVTTADRKHVVIAVPYASGALEAVAFRDGREIGRRRLETVGPPAKIRLTPEQVNNGSGRDDLSFVRVDVVDAQGRPVPEVQAQLEVTVNGVGELVAFGSANPLASGSYRSGTAALWHGRALAVVRGRGKPGRVSIQATGRGLAPALLSLSLSGGKIAQAAPFPPPASSRIGSTGSGT